MSQGQRTFTTSELRQLTPDGLRSFLGSRSSRRLANNTYAELDADGSVGVRLHATRILTQHPDGSFTVCSGGWETTTTKQRLNALMPAGYRIFSKSYRWMISTPNGDFPFESGDRWNVPELLVEPAATQEIELIEGAA